MTAPDQCCRNVRKFLPGRRPHVTQCWPGAGGKIEADNLERRPTGAANNCAAEAAANNCAAGPGVQIPSAPPSSIAPETPSNADSR